MFTQRTGPYLHFTENTTKMLRNDSQSLPTHETIPASRALSKQERAQQQKCSVPPYSALQQQ